MRARSSTGEMAKNGAWRRGQSLVEFALVLPILLILLMGLLDLGRLFYAYVGITGAAGEAAAYAAEVAGEYDLTNSSELETLESEVEDRAQQATEGLVEIGEGQVTLAATSESIEVTVTYTFSLLTPLVRNIVSDGELPLEAVAVRDI